MKQGTTLQPITGELWRQQGDIMRESPKDNSLPIMSEEPQAIITNHIRDEFEY